VDVQPSLVTGIAIGLAWVLAFGLLAAVAFALDTDGRPKNWFERWVLTPFVLLFIFGGGLLMFVYFSFGWLS